MNITIFLGKTITCILEDFVVKLRAPTTLIKIKLSGIKDFILGKQSVDSSQNRNVIGILFSSKITQKFIRWYTTLYRATQVVFSPSLDMLLTSPSFESVCLFVCLFVFSHLLLLSLSVCLSTHIFFFWLATLLNYLTVLSDDDDDSFILQ